MSLMMLITMVLCFALTVSVAVSIGLAAILGIQVSGINMLISVKEMFSSINKFPLAAIPFFILAGNLMETGGISRRLVEFAKSIVGGVQGGLPMTCVLTCMIFAAVSGSSVATTFAVGAILIPALIKHGYPTSYAAALQATSAELGVIIPPSIPMILYGVSAEVSIGELFIAGFGPGLLISGALMLFVYLYCRFKGWGKNDGDGRLGFLAATRQAGWALMMPVIILGGIYGGIFTPTEAGAITVLYTICVGLFAYRTLHWRHLPKILKETALDTSSVMLMICAAAAFGFYLAWERIPPQMAGWMLTLTKDPLALLLIINVMLIILGTAIEGTSALIILTPVFVPLLLKLNVDLVHFGVVLITNLTIAGITPPVGQLMFISSQVMRVPMEDYAVEVLPFLGAMLVVLLLLTVFPQITLWLPDLVFGVQP
jgi:tripartite ATP-independent transporter DctM subunit